MADATDIDDVAVGSETDATVPGIASYEGPVRTCAVTRLEMPRKDLLRFVAGPDGMIVPDVKAKLPGRGVWLTPSRAIVIQAVKKNAFARGLKRQVSAPSDLDETVDKLLAKSALGALGFARKAGQCITGAGKVESAARNGTALAFLHAHDGAEDGLRKLRQWVFSGAEMTGKDVSILRPFTASEMSLALGAQHVIHAAIMQGGAGRNALAQISTLVAYRDA